MSLRAALFKLPLPMPTTLPAPATYADAKADLKSQRARLAELSAYRTAIISNGLVPGGGVPVSLDEVNVLIATQREIIFASEQAVIALTP